MKGGRHTDEESSDDCEEEEQFKNMRSEQKSLRSMPCQNDRCDQEIICLNSDEFYCSRECYHLKQDRDKLEDKTIKFKRVTLVGRGGTGLLKDRDQLDHLLITVDDKFGRFVTVHNVGSGFDKWRAKLVVKAKRGNNSKIAYESKEEVKEEKQKLKELMTFYDDSEEETSSDEDNEDLAVKSTEIQEAFEEIQSLFCRGVNFNICPVHSHLQLKPKEKIQAYVITVSSPWEIYVQTAEMIKEAEKIDELCNGSEGVDSRLIIQDWEPKIGGFCCAKFEEKMYRAKILGYLEEENVFQVKYVDYGNMDKVSIKDVHQLNPEVTLIPRQCIYYRVSNAKPVGGASKWSSEVCQYSMENLDGAFVELEIENIERSIIHVGKLHVLSSLSNQLKGDFGNMIVKKNFADTDSYYLS